MNLIVVGTNHKYSPIEFRERISFSKKGLHAAFDFLKENFGLSYAVMLSTCNRVEIYASCEDLQNGLNSIENFLSIYHEIDKNVLGPYLYRYKGRDALRHLFEVASGLDSQVLGETQVLGQVKLFYEEAKGQGCTDDLLDGIFSAAIEIGKLVRIKTQISKGNVSIGSAAVSLISKEVRALRNKKVLIIGLGKVSSLVVKYLSKERVRAIIVSNRTYEKAQEMAKSIGGEAIRFDKLKENLKDVDVIISATRSPHVILKKEDIVTALSCKLSAISKKLLIIDLALPRDVDPGVREIEGVRLFDLDDLKSVIDKNIGKRMFEAEKASAIIEEEVNRLWERLIKLEREPARLL